jgi:hypothetical protein
MRLTTAELRAAHDALHRLIAHGESGEGGYTDAEVREAYDKVNRELRSRERRSARGAEVPR